MILTALCLPVPEGPWIWMKCERRPAGPRSERSVRWTYCSAKVWHGWTCTRAMTCIGFRRFGRRVPAVQTRRVLPDTDGRGPLPVDCRLSTCRPVDSRPRSSERVFEARRSLPWEIFVRDPKREVVFFPLAHLKNHDLTL